ncbi:heme-binding protein 2 isoform X2 [Ambystoma mexicanum]|uniref:heme-binding protein 2 isoform X2 n=1 Tax=Ambystoma mexicanum TaxID=8296 RepID=UPI0037E9A4AE
MWETAPQRTFARMLKTVKQALFSADLQAPKWSPVQNEASDYEIRQYEPAKWVSTVVTAMEWDPAISTGFMRLFSYIQGNNDKKTKMDMTAPVTCFINPGPGPFCESSITVSFYIPPEFQMDPPRPSESNVYIESRSALTVCVRTFGGFTNATKNQEQLLELGASLKRDGKVFDERVYYTAGYDSPFKMFNRCNEVWLIKIN